MDYFAGLDISMDETHVCVLDREGVVVRESKTEVTTAQAIAERIGPESAKLSSHRVRDRTNGRQSCFTGLNQLGLPVVCVESRQSLPGAQVTCDPTRPDRNDARGLAHLARTGFFQARSCEVAASSCCALRSLIHCAQEVGWPAGDLRKPDPRPGRRVRDPAASRRSPQPSSIRLSRQARGSPGLSAAMRGLITARTAVMTAVAAIDADMRRKDVTRAFGGLPSADDHPRRRPTDCARLCGRDRRSFAHPPIPEDVGYAYLGLVPRTRHQRRGEVDYVGSISKCGDRRVRTLLYGSRQCHVEFRYERPAQSSRTGRFAIARRSNDAQSAESLWLAASGLSCMRCCETRQSSYWPNPAARDRRPNPAPKRSDARGREQTTARIL